MNRPKGARIASGAFRLWSGPVRLALLFIALIFGAGCLRNEPPADIVIINGQEPESLDPAIVSGQAELRIIRGLFEGLTRLDPQTAEAVPGLAERWDISTDRKIYTFHLRPTAVWSTGRSITAQDFIESWRRVLEPATGAPYASQLFPVQGAEAFADGTETNFARVGIEAPDAHTLRVTLRQPTPFFLDLCAFPTLSVVPSWSIQAHGDRWLMSEPLPSSGPYTLVAWRLNDKVRLKKNPLYWDSANTRSDIMDLLPCASPATALNLYESGAADVLWDKELIPLDLIEVLRRQSDFHSYDYLGSYFLRFNVTRPPFDDVRVRKAIAMAIDRRRIVERITKAGERPATHLVPPGVAHYTPPEGLGYNPAEARRLLAEAGFPGGKGFPRLEYVFNSVKTHQKIAVELQDMWKETLGIETDLRQMEWKVFLRSQSSLDFGISRSSWIGDYNDPNTFLEIFTSGNGNNRTGWSNAAYDRLIREANATADLDRRASLFQQAERILVRDEVPIIPLYVYVGIEYFDAGRVHGIYPNLLAEHPLAAIWKE